MLKVGLKNLWNNKLKWIYFLRILSIWNHCAYPYNSHSKDSLLQPTAAYTMSDKRRTKRTENEQNNGIQFS